MNTPKKILSGLFYSIGGGYVARIASVGFTIWLKRELGLEPFDAALFYIFAFFMLANCTEGLGWALLHYQDQVDEFRDTHFTLNVLLGVGLVVLCVAISACLHWADPNTHHWGARAVPLLAVLYFFKRLATTSEFSLRKDFEFGRLSFIHGLSTVIALLAALWAAHRGLGEWSLIIGGWSNFSTLSAVYTILFVGGVLAVAAWMLPGISGSLVLVILGLYGPMLKALTSLDLIPLLTFGLGLVAGLVAFARVIRYLFYHYRDVILGFLTGLMAGSLMVLWPWRTGTDLLWPTHYAMGSPWVGVVGMMVLGMATVFMLVFASQRVD